MIVGTREGNTRWHVDREGLARRAARALICLGTRRLRREGTRDVSTTLHFLTYNFAKVFEVFRLVEELLGMFFDLFEDNMSVAVKLLRIY